MSASDLRDDIRKDKKSVGEWFILFLSIPLIIYYFTLDLWDYLVELNRYYADKLFLKRIRMTEAEFDQFMYWRIHVQDQPVQKLRPQPSFEDEIEDWFDELGRVDGEDGSTNDEIVALHNEVHNKD